MISRRLAAVAVSLLMFVGCHEDPTVINVLVQPTVSPLVIVSNGGTASSSTGLDGIGGQGGNFLLTTTELISLGSPAFIPVVPALPAPPTLGFAAVSPLASTTQPGTIQIAGAVTTAGTTPITVTSSTGDIVVSGALFSGDTGTAQSDIQLIALNGTVYVTGSIITAGSDAAVNGRSGGNLLIQAARVVITGAIDTHGVASNSAVATVSGGNGGNVDIQAFQGPIFFTSGAINTTGGSCTDTSGSTTIQGGNGGSVSFNAPGPVNSLYVFAPIATDGGLMSGTGTALGGNAGSITMNGVSNINVIANLSSLGGAAGGLAANATGGNGGTFSVDGAATFRFYGSHQLSGGGASASIGGGTVQGGVGGSVLLGQKTRLVSVEWGQGTYTMAGGAGEKDAAIGGGNGGKIAVESFDGAVTVASSLISTGGSAVGLGNTSGGAAGSMSFITDNQASGNLTNHPLSIPSLASLLDASGGLASGTGTGGAGGSLLLQCGGDLTIGAQIIVSGGPSVSGTGGSTTPLAPPIAGVDPTSAVILRVAAKNLTATGALTSTAPIQAQGGATSLGTTSGGGGGAGSSITLQITGGVGSLTSSGSMITSGASDPLGFGGASGSIFVSCILGDLTITGALVTAGATSPTVPTDSGNVTVQCGGLLTCLATINATGGSSLDPNGLISAHKGGAVLLNANGTFGGVLLLSGTTVAADGGAATVAVGAGVTGGTGGSITLQSQSQPISISGAFLARGGAAAGLGTGGTGGQMVINSDVKGSGIGGNITLNADGGIDVSGGAGFMGGSALHNGVDPGTALPSPPVNLAVVIDANSGLGNSQALNPPGVIPGTIINLGSIAALGGLGSPVGSGGDVFWNGLDALGVPVTALDGGVQNLGGTPPGQFYPH